MKQFILSILFFAASIASAFAQKVTLTGKVLDGATNGEPLPLASVILLNPKDSTSASGALTTDDGAFKLPSVKAGQYILRISYVGYKTHFQNLTLDKKPKAQTLAPITLAEDAVMLKAAEVTASAAQVEMRADTFVYNSAAYRLPEGSNLEELVRKIPGAEVDDDGNIKVNGKTVTKIMVGGKNFFDNDTKMAMKNIPTKMVENIKAYDRKSDYTRITGIDDGADETVLDLTVKKGMKEGWILNSDGAYGTEDRYGAKANLSHFEDHFQTTVIGSVNNVNDQSFPGGGRRGWGGGGGIVTSKMAGVNFAWENDKREGAAGLLKFGGNVRYSHRRNENQSASNSERFLSNTYSTFANSNSWSLSSNENVNMNFRFEWQIDSLTNLMVFPNFSHSQSHNNGENFSVDFNKNPYQYFIGDPLDNFDDPQNETAVREIVLNDNFRENRGNGASNNVNGSVQLNRRLLKPGRNVSLNLGGGYNQSENISFSRAEIEYHVTESTEFTNQYTPSNNKSYDYRAQLSYSEPIAQHLHLQFSYQYQFRYSDSDRDMYSIDRLCNYEMFDPAYTPEQLYMGFLPGLDTLGLLRNAQNSQYATYREHNQDASIMLRYINGETYNLSAGANLQPQTTHMNYTRHYIDTTITRRIINWAPRIDFRWKISNTSQMRVRYNAWMNQPSMTDLLDVIDNSNPLFISGGNPNLRSSWGNRFNLFYNNYIPDRQMGWMVNTSYNQDFNSVRTLSIEDMNTGVRYSRPTNINGSWNADANLMFNTALDAKKRFNIHTFTNLRYSHDVGLQGSRAPGDYLDEYLPEFGDIDLDGIFNSTEIIRATTKTTSVNENLRANYRNDIIEIGLNGGFNYMHAINKIQKNANLDTWTFSYGGNFQLNLPWNMQFNTDITQQSRRGYNDKTMNTNELIWNAQLSQNFLKKKNLTLSVQWYDILRQRSNISRNISATMRSDSWNNAIHSYAMFHIIYQLNLLGSQSARAGQHGGPDGPGGMRGPGGPGGMRGPGGRRGF